MAGSPRAPPGGRLGHAERRAQGAPPSELRSPSSASWKRVEMIQEFPPHPVAIAEQRRLYPRPLERFGQPRQPLPGLAALHRRAAHSGAKETVRSSSQISPRSPFLFLLLLSAI